MSESRGETANLYFQHARLFADGVYALNQLMILHPQLRAVDARVRPGRLEIVTLGGPGVKHDWYHSLPPVVVAENGFYTANGMVGVTDVLKTGHISVEIRRPL